MVLPSNRCPSKFLVVALNSVYRASQKTGVLLYLKLEKAINTQEGIFINWLQVLDHVQGLLCKIKCTVTNVLNKNSNKDRWNFT